MPRLVAAISSIILPCLLTGCSTTKRVPPRINPYPSDEWRLHYERSGFQETGRYDEVIDFCRRLDDASPVARYTTFGVSGEGRELPLLILSREVVDLAAPEGTSPTGARRRGKPCVLIQNCIHAGECEGKDATLILAREIALTGEHAGLLDHMNILIMPIFSVDGHERFGPYNRINQTGPREMGWRTTAINLNLNRDYMKADAPEMRGWLSVWTTWRPDLLIDNHTTNGHEHRYDVFYCFSDGPETGSTVARWVNEALKPRAFEALDRAGFLHMPYSYPRDEKDPAKGITAIGQTVPRLSTGYGALCNRPSLLVETHAGRPYERRVNATYTLNLAVLRAVAAESRSLRQAVDAADAQARQNRGAAEDGRIALRFELGPEAEPIVYHGVETEMYCSDVTGGDVIRYTTLPRDTPTQLFSTMWPTVRVTPPAAYIVPPQWQDVISRLEWHGIEFFRLREPVELEVDSYRFEDVRFRPQPYESRQMAAYKTLPLRQKRTYRGAAVVVPMNQPRGRLAAHLLEPEAPDSLLAWGFFNAIFEQKEYAEAYVMEPIAQRMLEEDAELREAFERRLREDESFAKSPAARLDFVYQRSPYHDERLNVYPVGRIDERQLAEWRRKGGGPSSSGG